MPSYSQNGFQWFADNLVDTNESALNAASAAGVTKVEKIGAFKKVTLNFSNMPVTVTDTGGANGGQGSLRLIDLPEGNVLFVNASTNLSIARVGTNLTATAAVVSSLGTAVAASSDATLTGTEANIVPSTTATLTAGAGTVKGQATAVAFVDGTDTPVSVYLNFAVPDAGITGNDSLLVSGSLVLTYDVSGDN